MNMIITITDDFDPEKIAASGQCFRWQKVDEKTCRILAADRCLYLSRDADQTYQADCDESTFQSDWYPYFDLDENYQAIREHVDPEQDPFLWRAMEQEKGIRILRQDPWEMLITSVITQNRNIPAIQRSIELLSRACRNHRYDSRGREYYAFPDPAQLIMLNEQELLDCKLGYRWKYVHAAAEAVADGKINLRRLQEADCGEAVRQLTGIYGIGHKVANCVALFGLHQLDAFPRDVWINRVLENEYPNGYPFKNYSPYNGVYQQYMFAYYRNHPFSGGHNGNQRNHGRFCGITGPGSDQRGSDTGD